MALPTVLEKLQYNNEKNILIQGLPSSLEKQFVKLSFAKSVTPLIRKRKIDFALVFSVNKTQLKSILAEVVPAMAEDTYIRVSYPKVTSKIVSDITRDNDWSCMAEFGFCSDCDIDLDNVWAATRFTPANIEVKVVPSKSKKSETVEELA